MRQYIVTALAALVAVFGAHPAFPADTPEYSYGASVQTNGLGFACGSLETLREIEFASAAKDDPWIGAVGGCTYLRDGTNGRVVGENGTSVLIRAIMTSGAGALYWVRKGSLKSPCYVSSGCR